MRTQSQRATRRSCLILCFIIPLSLCACWGFFTFFADDVFGTINEFFSRYPESKFIWVGYGAYGSYEYGDKSYVRRTEDDTELVRSYYGDNPDVEVIPVKENYWEDLWICHWAGFFAYKPNSGCKIVKRDTPNYGTLIVYSHSFWAG
jgi:hypothetical protein